MVYTSRMFTENRRFKARRIELGLTQAQLAKAVAGLHSPDISKIEAQGWTPPAGCQAALATALQTTPDALWGTAAHPPIESVV